MSDKYSGGTYQNPSGVRCLDCPVQCRWYPRSDRTEPHKHEIVTDHEVEYVDADEIRKDVNADGTVVYRHDEQQQLMTDGGTGRIDQGQARKDRGLLKHDYSEPCPLCGGVVFEWWDSETCRDCDQADDSTDVEQTTLTDGGSRQRDPAEDPRACSKCGVHIGLFGDEYCDGCAREIGVKSPMRRCVHCGQRGPEEQMEAIDVSAEDEYYPTFEFLCRSCFGGESA